MIFSVPTTLVVLAIVPWAFGFSIDAVSSSATAQSPPHGTYSQKPTGNLFQLKACNGTSDRVSVMVIHQDHYDPSKTIMFGWKQVPPRNCEITGFFPRASTFVFARKDNGTYKWPIAGPHYCVSPRQTFRKVFPNEECIKGEGREPFIQVYHGRAEETVQFRVKR